MAPRRRRRGARSATPEQIAARADARGAARPPAAARGSPRRDRRARGRPPPARRARARRRERSGRRAGRRAGRFGRRCPQPLAQRREARFDAGQARRAARSSSLSRAVGVDALRAPLGERAIEHLADAAMERVARRGHEVGQPRLEVLDDLLEARAAPRRAALSITSGSALLGLRLDLARRRAPSAPRPGSAPPASSRPPTSVLTNRKMPVPSAPSANTPTSYLSVSTSRSIARVGRPELARQRRHRLGDVLVGDLDDLLGQPLEQRRRSSRPRSRPTPSTCPG